MIASNLVYIMRTICSCLFSHLIRLCNHWTWNCIIKDSDDGSIIVWSSCCQIWRVMGNCHQKSSQARRSQTNSFSRYRTPWCCHLVHCQAGVRSWIIRVHSSSRSKPDSFSLTAQRLVPPGNLVCLQTGSLYTLWFLFSGIWVLYISGMWGWHLWFSCVCPAVTTVLYLEWITPCI